MSNDIGKEAATSIYNKMNSELVRLGVKEDDAINILNDYFSDRIFFLPEYLKFNNILSDKKIEEFDVIINDYINQNCRSYYFNCYKMDNANTMGEIEKINNGLQKINIICKNRRTSLKEFNYFPILCDLKPICSDWIHEAQYEMKKYDLYYFGNLGRKKYVIESMIECYFNSMYGIALENHEDIYQLGTDLIVDIAKLAQKPFVFDFCKSVKKIKSKYDYYNRFSNIVFEIGNYNLGKFDHSLGNIVTMYISQMLVEIGNSDEAVDYINHKVDIALKEIDELNLNGTLFIKFNPKEIKTIFNNVIKMFKTEKDNIFEKSIGTKK